MDRDDEVRLFFTRASHPMRPRQPENGYPGVVLRTGKKYAWALFSLQGDPYEVCFDAATGMPRADMEGMLVLTPQQAEDRSRRKAALWHLRTGALRCRLPCSIT